MLEKRGRHEAGVFRAGILQALFWQLTRAAKSVGFRDTRLLILEEQQCGLIITATDHIEQNKNKTISDCQLRPKLCTKVYRQS